jgi:hypothetical protein
MATFQLETKCRLSTPPVQKCVSFLWPLVTSTRLTTLSPFFERKKLVLHYLIVDNENIFQCLIIETVGFFYLFK